MSRGLRVVAGEARGVPLSAPDGSRPTTGRVREAVFSSLGDVIDMSVLDLYAGSGALAIEALSRGAARALLVDSDRAAVAVCRRNLEATRLASRARVTTVRVATLLGADPPAEAPFDLVVADPPYDEPDDAVVAMLDALAAAGWLADGARVVVERASRTGLPSLPPGWGRVWERTYGDTLVAVFRLTA
ncbi:MAG: 16S rRNA (guanine(966)-N(2))-methyltransferase RsmD [Acidimicrobiia bacterium]|jgi:16S rRNA (guanine966-N2)-methyltransferase